MKIPAAQHRKFEARLSTAETATAHALAQLRDIFQTFRAVPDVQPYEAAIDQAHFDGWLDAIRVVAESSVFDGHDDIRTALLDELERLGIKAKPKDYPDPPRVAACPQE